jgi:hypothetical protein
MKHTLKLVTLVVSTFALASFLRAGPPSAADVGDAESFGHAALYMGAASGFVQLKPACTPAPPPVPPNTANNDQCFVLNPQPATTSFTANDILRIKLPKKATRTIIYPAINFFVSYELRNQTAGDDTATFSFFSSMVIESDALVGVNDPTTGDPLNGKLDVGFGYSYIVDRTLPSTHHDHQRITLVRVGNAGINKAALVAQGFSQSVVDNLFSGPMTVRMNMTGSGKLLNMGPSAGFEGATITANMRLFGD